MSPPLVRVKSAPEHLLRKTTRQSEIYEVPFVKGCCVSQEMKERNRTFRRTLDLLICDDLISSFELRELEMLQAIFAVVSWINSTTFVPNSVEPIQLSSSPPWFYEQRETPPLSNFMTWGSGAVVCCPPVFLRPGLNPALRRVVIRPLLVSTSLLILHDDLDGPSVRQLTSVDILDTSHRFPALRRGTERRLDLGSEG